jgi:lysophospholipase L1-like esterase
MLNPISVSNCFKTFPAWAFLSLAANGLLMLAVILLLVREHWLPASTHASDSTALQMPRWGVSSNPRSKMLASPANLGPFHQLSYEEWIGLLRREAEVAAENPPKHLNVIAGDSLSMWFPTTLLPPERHWLNQGISGETSAGLLRRLALFDQAQPEVIYVMIGINDLLRGVKDETILMNQRQMIRYLRRVHPQSQIVFQSILPHAGASANWEGRDRLLKIPNGRIHKLNQQLAQVTAQEGISYLDLYPLFIDAQGDLRSELSTDGLHLNSQGYLVWSSALQVYTQLKLQPKLQQQKSPPSSAPRHFKIKGN